jgi:hypothetical protein
MEVGIPRGAGPALLHDRRIMNLTCSSIIETWDEYRAESPGKRPADTHLSVVTTAPIPERDKLTVDTGCIPTFINNLGNVPMM